MRGNEGELDAAVFLFWWRRRGDRGGDARLAGDGAVLGFDAGGRRRPVVGWAVMVGWAGRESEAQWGGEGKLAGRKKRMGHGWAERPDGPKAEENYFRNFFWIFEYTKALEICTRKFRRNFDMRIFPKFS
jgi:hypothetical protein